MAERELEELEISRRISASPEAVYKAWTEPELMKQWLAPNPNIVIYVDNDPIPGGILHIEMNSPDGNQHFIDGKYQKLTPHSFIAKSWKYSGPVDIIQDIETLLEINFTAVDRGFTDLKLTQSRLKTKEACDAYEADWPSCLDKLQNIFLH